MRAASPIPFVAMTIALVAGPARADSAAVDAFVACSEDAASRLEAAVGTSERTIRWTATPRIDASDILQRPNGEQGPAERVWIDCSRSDRVRLTFADPASERFLVRDVPVSQGLGEVALETLAQVIDSSLSALESDAAAGLNRTQMTSALAPTPGPTPAPASIAPAETPTPRWGKGRWQGRLEAFYAVEALGPGPLFQHGPGLLVDLGRSEGPWRATAWALAQYAFPEMVATSLIGARLDVVALRGGAEIAHAVSNRVALGARIGAGADVVHVSSRQGSGGATADLSPDHVVAAPVALAAVTLTAHVGGAVAISGAALADVDLAYRHYDVAIGGAPVRAFAPWPVRPGLMAGVGWP